MNSNRNTVSRLLFSHCLFALIFALLLLPSVSLAQDPPIRPVIIPVEGVITPLTKQFLVRRLSDAEKLGSNLVIFEIDSPGGMVGPSFEITEMLRELNWATTVAYIPREALSAAAFVTLACDKVLIDPDARLGDAAPIVMGEDAMFRHAPEKITSDIALRVRELAEANGRPPALAEAMVKDMIVYEVKHAETGEIAYMSEAEIRDSDEPAAWIKNKPVFESREDHFFECTGKRAVELGLGDVLVGDMEGLQAELKLEGPPRRLAATWVDTIVYILNNSFVSGLLLVVGLISLYLGLQMPSFGLCAGLCFSLFFWSRFLGGTAGWLEVVLFVLGVVCMGLEIFVIPGFGVTGVTGILLLVVSFVLASQTFIFPHNVADVATIGKSLRDLAIVAVVFVLLAVFVSRHFDSLPIFGHMILSPVDGPDDDPVTGMVEEESGELPIEIGAEGITKTPLRPAGKVRLDDGRTVDVVAEGAFVGNDVRIQVYHVQGNRIVVRELEQEEA